MLSTTTSTIAFAHSLLKTHISAATMLRMERRSLLMHLNSRRDPESKDARQDGRRQREKHRRFFFLHEKKTSVLFSFSSPLSSSSSSIFFPFHSSFAPKNRSTTSIKKRISETSKQHPTTPFFFSSFYSFCLHFTLCSGS